MSPRTPVKDRRNPSRCLTEIRKPAALRRFPENPGERMLAAYDLSVEARNLFVAGMRARGLSDDEIRTHLKRRRR
jgi:hypothetical protein